MIRLQSYTAYFHSTLLLTLRDRVVLFFSYLFPLLFFVAFGEGFGAMKALGAATQVVTMVLVLGVLGNGFFGGGMRATLERELGILRRFKVAPITPAPILVASIVTGLVVFLPAVALFLAIAKLRYAMPVPSNLFSLCLVLSVGVVAFRSMGLIVASVVNSMAESQIIIQLLYFPMLLLSGATIPLTALPEWLQALAQFLPATHLYLSMQGILMRNESAADHLSALAALTLTTLVCLFISVKLFRWERDEKLRPKAKLWVAVALAPFLLLGGWQAWSKTNLQKTKILAREQRRSITWLIRDARVFTGDERVLPVASVLVREGRVAQVYEGRVPDSDAVRAESMEAAGRTLLPGLLDLWVSLPDDARAAERALAAQLYCGVTGVVAAARNPVALLPVMEKVRSGEVLGAEILQLGPSRPPAGASLAAVEWSASLAAAETPALLARSLAQQLLKPAELDELKVRLAGLSQGASPAEARAGPEAAYSGAGVAWLPHGPSLHRQLQLMAREGISPLDALARVTRHAAERLGMPGLGVIKPGAEANLVLVDGNPLEDISATERIVAVFFKGERVNRPALLGDEK